MKHLNYIGAKHGGYEAYPDLAGKGDEAVPTIWYKPRRIRVPCGACPALKKIIAEYMICLASKGARVVITTRDIAKGEEVAREIRKSAGEDLALVEELELGSLASIRSSCRPTTTIAWYCSTCRSNAFDSMRWDGRSKSR